MHNKFSNSGFCGVMELTGHEGQWKPTAAGTEIREQARRRLPCELLVKFGYHGAAAWLRKSQKAPTTKTPNLWEPRLPEFSSFPLSDVATQVAYGTMHTHTHRKL